MTILFPSVFKEIDMMFEDQYNAAKAAGFEIAFFSEESKVNCFDEELLYKGWILKNNEYQELIDASQKKRNTLIVKIDEYNKFNYLNNWYPLLRDFTMKTEIITNPIEDKYKDVIKSLNWDAYFIKDFVKSLKTSRGSLAKNIDEVEEIISEIIRTREGLEGGLILRENVNLEGETRYFSIKGTILTPDGKEAPSIVKEISKILTKEDSLSFFSIDISLNKDTDELILVEIGDAQVSDPVGWDYEFFYRELFKAI